MSGNIWTLAKTLTVKEKNEQGRNVWSKKSDSWKFASFEEARDAFRQLARECAMAKSNVFDGDGNIRNLQDYFDGLAEGLEEARRDPQPTYTFGSMILRGAPDIAFMAGDFESARSMPAAIRSWLLDMGSYDASPLPEFKWTDWCIGIVSKPKSLAVGCIVDQESRASQARQPANQRRRLVEPASRRALRGVPGSPRQGRAAHRVPREERREPESPGRGREAARALLLRLCAQHWGGRVIEDSPADGPRKRPSKSIPQRQSTQGSRRRGSAACIGAMRHISQTNSRNQKYDHGVRTTGANLFGCSI